MGDIAGVDLDLLSADLGRLDPTGTGVQVEVTGDAPNYDAARARIDLERTRDIEGTDRPRTGVDGEIGIESVGFDLTDPAEGDNVG